jgi:hypothetical protein
MYSLALVDTCKHDGTPCLIQMFEKMVSLNTVVRDTNDQIVVALTLHPAWNSLEHNIAVAHQHCLSPSILSIKRYVSL